MEGALSASPTPFELEIVATGRPRLAQSLRELWAYRGTILAFAERDVRVKYKQAVLGVAWALLQFAGAAASGGVLELAALLREYVGHCGLGESIVPRKAEPGGVRSPGY